MPAAGAGVGWQSQPFCAPHGIASKNVDPVAVPLSLVSSLSDWPIGPAFAACGGADALFSASYGHCDPTD